MPLSDSVSENIRELIKANKTRKKKRTRRQILAIAISAAKKLKLN